MLKLSPAYDALKTIMVVEKVGTETAAINQTLIARKPPLLKMSTK
jgi:hypothetical protein